MRKLSVWAKRNKWKARITIIVSHLVLILLAWYTGNRLSAMGNEPPAFLVYIFAIIYFVAVFAYPSAKNKTRVNAASLYIKQKLCDFTLAATTFCMIMVFAGNSGVLQPLFQSSLASSVSVTTNKENKTAAEILASLKYRDKSTLTRQEKRILKQEFKTQLKIYTVAKLSGDKRASGEAGLIILAIVAALGLLYLVAALSCSLSCNGSEGAATVVAVLGVAAVIVGLVFVIRSINRKSNRKIETQTPG